MHFSFGFRDPADDQGGVYDQSLPGAPATGGKYPWGEMRVGEVRVIHDVPSRGAAHASLQKWRDKVLAEGLGYTTKLSPRFHLSYDADRQQVRATRLPDGPLKAHSGLSPAAMEHVARDAEVQAIMHAQEAWIAANVARIAAGEPRQTCPPPLMDKALLCDARFGTNLAKGLAVLDNTSIEDLESNPHPRRRKDDTPELSSYDEARDAALALRLRSACKSSQPR